MSATAPPAPARPGATRSGPPRQGDRRGRSPTTPPAAPDAPTWPATAALALTVVTATFAWQRVFGLAAVAVPAVLAGAVVAVAASLRRRPMPRAAATALSGVAALAVPLVTALTGRPAVGVAELPARLGEALVNGWATVLTTSLPAPARGELLALVGALAAGAGLAAGVLAGPPHRMPAVLPSLGLLVAGLAFGVGGPGSLLAVAAPYTLALAAYAVAAEAATRPRDTHTAATWTRRAARGVAALTVPIVALWAGPLLPAVRSRPAVDPRDHVRVPAEQVTVADPLALLPGRLAHPDGLMFTAAVPPSWRGRQQSWRLVTFDSFDGTRWTTSSAAGPVGYQLPGPPGTPTDRVTVTVAGLTGAWVPVPGQPRTVDVAGLRYDPVTQTLVDPALAPLRRYTVETVTRSPGQPPIDPLPDENQLRRLTALPPCTPAELVALARAVAGTSTEPAELVARLDRALADDPRFGYHLTAFGGHSCGRLRDLLTVDHLGTPEQFAPVGVLMARSLGLPARLVVGFLPGSLDGDGRTVRVSSGDAYAWPEVYVAGAGWVALDPTPAPRTAGAKPRTKPVRSLPTVAPAAAPDPGHPSAATRTGAPGHVAEPEANRPGSMLAVGAFVLLLAGAVVSAVPALRRRRRRRIRRRQPDPRARVLGAWAETREALQRLGPDLTAATMDDVVVRLRATDHELSGPATTMASLVDRAVYAPAVDGVPALTGRDADRAWSTGRALVSGVRRCRWRQRRRRWRALVRSGRCRPGADATER